MSLQADFFLRPRQSSHKLDNAKVKSLKMKEDFAVKFPDYVWFKELNLVDPLAQSPKPPSC